MNSKDAATRQDVVENSAWPRQYLETYLDSDATGRAPFDAEQLQDVLEAAFERDAVLAREYLEELNSERGPKRLGE
jgi:hypothetical protein